MKRIPAPGRGRVLDLRGRGTPPPIVTPLQRLTPNREDTRDPTLPPVPSRARAMMLPPAAVSEARKRALMMAIAIHWLEAWKPRPVGPRRGGR